MGSCISQEPDVDFDGPVDFNHFHILRAIGKGAFGKVCIVKKRDTKEMYALKYMSKIQMIQKRAVDNVFREIKLLRGLEHPYLVNLWFTFHDREDIFMVLDLMLGGDLNYHLEKVGRFSVSTVRLYIAEMGMALDYLRSKLIIHRDLKPANMLLDTKGHVHITDFNVATLVRPQYPVTSTTGTKPYMAPEVILTRPGGYSFPVDWWGLGVTAYELLRGSRPFAIDKNITPSSMHELISFTRPKASSNWDKDTCDILRVLLHPNEESRMQSVERLKKHPFFAATNWDDVENKTVTPSFVPPQNRINCDPTHELEEMIVEPNPLHKKQHRLSKRNRRKEDESTERELTKIEERFKVYNRITEKEKKEAQKALEESGQQDEGGASTSPEADGAEGGGDKSIRNSREVVGDKHSNVSATAWNDGGNGDAPLKIIPEVKIEVHDEDGASVNMGKDNKVNDKVRKAPVKLEVIADVEVPSDKEDAPVEKEVTGPASSEKEAARDSPVVKIEVADNLEGEIVNVGGELQDIPVVQVEPEAGEGKEGNVKVEGGIATDEGSGIGFVEGEGSTSLMRLVDGSGGLIREMDRAMEDERLKKAQQVESSGNTLSLPAKGSSSRRTSQDTLNGQDMGTVIVSGLPDDDDSGMNVHMEHVKSSEGNDANSSEEVAVAKSEKTATENSTEVAVGNSTETTAEQSEETPGKKALEQDAEVKEKVRENGEHICDSSDQTPGPGLVPVA